MKRIVLLILVICFFTGCRVDALKDYKDALKATGAIKKGIMKVSFNGELEFNTEGLTDQEIRDLSYFDHIEVSFETQYDVADVSPKSITKTYYNFGGMGLDSTVYSEGLLLYMKLPVINKYIDLSAYNDSKEQGMVEAPFIDVFGKLMDIGYGVLTQKDVFRGKKTYILTTEGQIKTTMYTLEADEQQLKTVGNELADRVEEAGLLTQLKGFMPADADFNTVALQDGFSKHIESMILETFEGIAYVDFDGRMVKESFEAKVRFTDPLKGDIRSMVVSFEIEYLKLGKAQVFEFPVVKEEEWLDLNKDYTMEDFFPADF